MKGNLYAALVSALVLTMTAGAKVPPVAAASSHSVMECEASFGSVRPGAMLSIRVEIECASGLLGTHPIMEGSSSASLQLNQDGFYEGNFRVDLQDSSIVSFPNKRHADVTCRGEVFYVPDSDGFTRLDRYLTHMMCQPTWSGYHPWHYCAQSPLESLQTSPIDMPCRVVATATRRSFQQWDHGPDRELLISAVGKRNGTLVIRVYAEEVSEVTIRQFRLNDTIKNTIVPVINGVARLRSSKPGLQWGTIVIGEPPKYYFGETAGAWVYAISPTIWWGNR